MPKVDLISCPYDLGRRNWRCGVGPTRILQAGAVASLEAAGATVRTVEIETEVSYACEAGLVFEAQRQIAARVAQARAAGRLPLVLGGNCNTAVGGISGVGASNLGLLWFDAHGDFCTPETTASGFLDGMGLAMVVGRCWQTAMASIPGYAAIAETRTALVGARDLDPWEIRDLASSAITQLSDEDIRARGVQASFEPFLIGLSSQVDGVYLHIDLDVLDPSEAPVNQYDAPGGLSVAGLCQAIALIGQHLPIVGAGLGSYDPSVDAAGKTAAAAIAVLQSVIRASRAI